MATSLLVLLLAVLHVSSGTKIVGRVHRFGDTHFERLAAKEARRYWMLVSGAERGALTIAAPLSDMHHGLPAIVVATKGQSVLNDYLLHHADDLQLAQAVRSELLAPDSHVVHTLKSTASTTKGAAGVGGPGRVIVCVGATPRASLYAVYSLMELLGTFANIAPLSETYTPRFSVRGLQPFHDFPMGPDFWQPSDWRVRHYIPPK
eukprot:gene20540-5788_t